MRRSLILLFLLLLISGAGWELWRVHGPAKEAPFWIRYSPNPANRENSLFFAWQRMASGSRIWTDLSGRTIEAIPIAANDQTLRLRLLKTETVYNLPLERLSEGDREFVAEWRKTRAGSEPFELAPTDRWPPVYHGRVDVMPAPSPVGATGASQIWRTPRYELRSFGPLDSGVVRSLASICESIDGACRAIPLPMLWGRADDTLRIISIYPDETSYRAAGGLPATAGCFSGLTGEVLICEPALRETDFLGQAKGFSLEKRQRYHVLVHELVHQASLGITLGRFPAWVSEGLAEFFSATQRSPGQFQFRDSHLAVKNHLVGTLPYDGVVELAQYPIWTLDSFLDRNLNEWNHITARDDKHGQGWIQYAQATVIVEFFCRADSPEGARFRSYLEAVLTGADPGEAASIHLLAGRSYAELEQAMAAYWGRQGVNLSFVENPSLGDAGIRFGIGLGRGSLP